MTSPTNGQEKIKPSKQRNKYMKTKFYFKISKEDVKGAAWLATVSVKEPEVPNDGRLKREHVSAWSSLPAAKRWAAGVINRKSIRWTVSEDKKLLTAEVEVKI